jgi:peptide/nickel transport system substrate-binding protein
MKRLSIILAVIIVICTLAISCSSKSETPKSSTSTSTTKAQTSAASTSTTKASTSAASTSASGSTTPATPKYGGEFILIQGVLGSPFGWPVNIIGGTTQVILPALESLLRMSKDGVPSPWLAESYDVKTDEPSVTFHLRKGIKFHDGSDFNASVVKFDYDICISKNKAPYWKSVEVVDDYTVKVVLNYWVNIAMASFSDSAIGLIASMQSFKANGEAWANNHPIGTGPFIFQKYDVDSAMYYNKNPNYWQQGKPYVDKVKIVFADDPQVTKNMMISGEGMAVNYELGKQTKEMLDLGFKTITQHQATYCLIPDTKNPKSPLANQKVREAIEYAIDKESIAKGLGYGFWVAPYQMPPKDNAAWNDKLTFKREYNVAKAKQLLTEAGYPNGFSIEVVPGYQKNTETSVAIKSFLDAVGIKTTLTIMDTAAYNQYRSGDGWANAMLMEPIASYANYNQTLNYYFSPTTAQFKSWDRTEGFLAKFNASIRTAQADINVIRDVDRYMYENAMIIPVHDGGASLPVANYVMDGGFLQRNFPVYWNPESVWLNK